MFGSACISGNSSSLRWRSSGVLRSCNFSTHSLSVKGSQGLHVEYSHATRWKCRRFIKKPFFTSNHSTTKTSYLKNGSDSNANNLFATDWSYWLYKWLSKLQLKIFLHQSSEQINLVQPRRFNNMVEFSHDLILNNYTRF